MKKYIGGGSKAEEGGTACGSCCREFKECTGTSGDDRLREAAIYVMRSMSMEGAIWKETGGGKGQGTGK